MYNLDTFNGRLSHWLKLTQTVFKDETIIFIQSYNKFSHDNHNFFYNFAINSFYLSL